MARSDIELERVPAARRRTDDPFMDLRRQDPDSRQATSRSRANPRNSRREDLTCRRLEDILADPLAGGHRPGRAGEWTLALSLAYNRASKIDRLTSRGEDDLAERFATSLHADVETFLQLRLNHPPRFAVALREASSTHAREARKAGQI